MMRLLVMLCFAVWVGAASSPVSGCRQMFDTPSWVTTYSMPLFVRRPVGHHPEGRVALCRVNEELSRREIKSVCKTGIGH